MSDQETSPEQINAEGVDLTLIRWMLEMTPAERLAALQSFVDAVWEARGGEDAA